MSVLDASCPVPVTVTGRVQMAHGGGGRLMQDLIRSMFERAFDNPLLAERHDAAVFDSPGRKLAFTTDGYVVKPTFFPGGDVGKLAVCGTVNDLAMGGARPRYLSAGFILEEGLPLEDLERIVRSMAETAREAGVAIVTGDTKVVERGKGDGVYITTAGVGEVPDGVDLRPSRVRAGDAILVSGDIGRHGVAVLSARESLGFEGEIASDCALLHDLARAVLESGAGVRCLRDLTRGGLGAALDEIAHAAGATVELEEARVPVSEIVHGACELLGLDPVFVANEGRLVAFVPEADAERALSALSAHPLGAGAARVGRVVEGPAGRVEVINAIGTRRIQALPAGEQLPRIC